jgi:hypothetical protein
MFLSPRVWPGMDDLERFDLVAGQREALMRDVMAAEAGAAARAGLPTGIRLAVAAGLRHILPAAWFERLRNLVRRMPASRPA